MLAGFGTHDCLCRMEVAWREHSNYIYLLATEELFQIKIRENPEFAGERINMFTNRIAGAVSFAPAIWPPPKISE